MKYSLGVHTLVDLFGRTFFCSWSGGKDSCLALYRALQGGGKPHCLLTVLEETGTRSRSHALPPILLQKQAEALAIPLVTCNATWQSYEKVFIHELGCLKQAGVEVGVFGDIDLDAHREWEEKVSATAAIEPVLPLWQESRLHLVEEFIELGFEAIIVAVKDDVLDQGFLNRRLDQQLVDEFLRLGIDPAGEAGEFHTFVTNGPIFKHAVEVHTHEVVQSGGYSFVSCS